MRLIYEKLLSVLGHQHWWPADTPFEVVVGALVSPVTFTTDPADPVE